MVAATYTAEAATDVDVVVIGAGPGGYVAAIRAAGLGKSVVVIDKAEVGGVCLNRGCIPSKALISAAHQYEAMARADHIGISAERIAVNFNKVQQWKDGVVRKLTGGVASLLKANKIAFVHGEACFAGERVVRVTTAGNTVFYRFRDCIIATGSRPHELKATPFGGRVLSSTEALSLADIPPSLVVIGGGYIGIELCQMFAKFGTKATVLEGGETILPGFEKELSQWIGRALKKQRVDVFTQAVAHDVKQTGNDVTVFYTAKGEAAQVTADYALVTIGRRPNTDGLGLQSIGIATNERGLIEIDGQCRTSVPNVYAIGDIVSGPALAHKASYEGKVAAEAIAGFPSVIDYKAMPAVVFSDPEIASIGLNEAEAKEAGYAVSVGKFPYAANGRALSMDAAEGFMKVVADASSGSVLGAQIVGAESSNLIAELALAIEMGARLEDIALTIHAHPTLGEMAMESAEAALGRPTHLVASKIS